MKPSDDRRPKKQPGKSSSSAVKATQNENYRSSNETARKSTDLRKEKEKVVGVQISGSSRSSKTPKKPPTTSSSVVNEEKTMRPSSSSVRESLSRLSTSYHSSTTTPKAQKWKDESIKVTERHNDSALSTSEVLSVDGGGAVYEDDFEEYESDFEEDEDENDSRDEASATNHHDENSNSVVLKRLANRTMKTFAEENSGMARKNGVVGYGEFNLYNFEHERRASAGKREFRFEIADQRAQQFAEDDEQHSDDHRDDQKPIHLSTSSSEPQTTLEQLRTRKFYGYYQRLVAKEPRITEAFTQTGDDRRNDGCQTEAPESSCAGVQVPLPWRPVIPRRPSVKNRDMVDYDDVLLREMVRRPMVPNAQRFAQFVDVSAQLFINILTSGNGGADRRHVSEKGTCLLEPKIPTSFGASLRRMKRREKLALRVDDEKNVSEIDQKITFTLITANSGETK